MTQHKTMKRCLIGLLGLIMAVCVAAGLMMTTTTTAHAAKSLYVEGQEGGTVSYVNTYPHEELATIDDGAYADYYAAIGGGAYVQLKAGQYATITEFDMSSATGYNDQSHFANSVGAYPVTSDVQTRTSVLELVFVPQAHFHEGDSAAYFDSDRMYIEFSDGTNVFTIISHRNYYDWAVNEPDETTGLFTSLYNGGIVENNRYLSLQYLGYDGTFGATRMFMRIYYNNSNSSFTVVNGGGSGGWLGVADGFDASKTNVKVYFDSDSYAEEDGTAGVMIYSINGKHVTDSNIPLDDSIYLRGYEGGTVSYVSAYPHEELATIDDNAFENYYNAIGGGAYVQLKAGQYATITEFDISSATGYNDQSHFANSVGAYPVTSDEQTRTSVLELVFVPQAHFHEGDSAAYFDSDRMYIEFSDGTNVFTIISHRNYYDWTVNDPTETTGLFTSLYNGEIVATNQYLSLQYLGYDGSFGAQRMFMRIYYNNANKSFTVVNGGGTGGWLGIADEFDASKTTVKVYFDSDSYAEEDGTAGVMIYSINGKHVEAANVYNKAIVSFDSVGGTAIDPQEIVKGNVAEEPEDPTKIGYDFVGWFLDDEEFDFETPVTEDITLVAEWEVKTFTVTFNMDGGTLSDGENNITSLVVDYGTSASELDALTKTKTGCTFSKWQYLDNGSYVDLPSTATVQGDISVKAVWTINTYTLTFDSDGGSEVAAQTVNYGAKATKPANPTKSGYNFKGWFVGDTEYDFNADVTANATLTAKWEEAKSGCGSSINATSVAALGAIAFVGAAMIVLVKKRKED